MRRHRRHRCGALSLARLDGLPLVVTCETREDATANTETPASVPPTDTAPTRAPRRAPGHLMRLASCPPQATMREPPLALRLAGAPVTAALCRDCGAAAEATLTGRPLCAPRARLALLPIDRERAPLPRAAAVDARASLHPPSKKERRASFGYRARHAFTLTSCSWLTVNDDTN